MKGDVYKKVTDRIIADLEKGELTWLKPWNAENTAGRITRPKRHNGLSYGGINVLMLWAAAIEAGYSAACWMTFRQAIELGAHVRRGEKGSMVALTPEPGADHAAYIQSWLKVLRPDKRALFSAAAHAQRAVEFLHGLQSSAGTGREAAA